MKTHVKIRLDLTSAPVAEDTHCWMINMHVKVRDEMGSKELTCEEKVFEWLRWVRM